jgi:hypothetical protein
MKLIKGIFNSFKYLGEYMSTKKMYAILILSIGLLNLSPVFAHSAWSPLTDSVNSGIINTKMISEDSLSSIQVDVTVVNGVAIFKGEVQSEVQRNELVRIAKSVSGIKEVDVSKIQVLGQ